MLNGRFHTNILKVIFGKPVTQRIQIFCEERKACLLILGRVVGSRNINTGIEPSFEDIKPIAAEP